MRQRGKRRGNRPLRLILGGLLLAAVAYVLAAAWWQSRDQDQAFSAFLLPRLVDLVVVAWLFWVGAALGSFLNVVAYRLPQGRSIGGFSACPYCAQPIARGDNVPVFGWLAIRGRCRVCRMPISPRYPLVELCVGLSLTLVGWGSIYHGGANLPYFSTGGLGDGLWMPHLTKTSLAIGTYQLLVVTGSWAFGLIRFDGQRIPVRLLGWVFAIAILPLLLWPPLQIVPWEVQVADDWQPSSYIASLLRVVTALAAAGLVGRGLGRALAPRGDIKMSPLGEQTSRLLDLIAMLAVPALLVGWQALFGVALAACLLAVLLGRWMPARGGLARLAVTLPPCLAVQLAAWRWLDRSPFWPGTHSHPWTLLGFAFALLIVAQWLKRPARPATAATTPLAEPPARVPANPSQPDPSQPSVANPSVANPSVVNTSVVNTLDDTDRSGSAGSAAPD